MSETAMLRGINCVVVQCGVCGVPYTVPEIVHLEHYREGGFSFCPNGHQWGWVKDQCERERLRRERDLLKQRVAQRDDEARHLREQWNEAEKRAEQERRSRQRVEKRVHAGVCPDCNRSFVNMARHMATKHAKPKLVAV